MTLIQKIFISALFVLQLVSCASSQNTEGRSHTPPTHSYVERVRIEIAKNILIDNRPKGPAVTVVRATMAPDGRILGTELIHPSGESAWDAAVLRALARTERLPLDEHGYIPEYFDFSFSPR